MKDLLSALWKVRRVSRVLVSTYCHVLLSRDDPCSAIVFVSLCIYSEWWCSQWWTETPILLGFLASWCVARAGVCWAGNIEGRCWMKPRQRWVSKKKKTLSRWDETWTFNRHGFNISCEFFFPFFLLFRGICLHFFSSWYAKQVQRGKNRSGKYRWSKWEDETLLELRGLERAPFLAGSERRTSRPHRRAYTVDPHRT